MGSPFVVILSYTLGGVTWQSYLRLHARALIGPRHLTIYSLLAGVDIFVQAAISRNLSNRRSNQKPIIYRRGNLVYIHDIDYVVIL